MYTPDSQEILKTIIEESHTPIALYVGRELIVTVANAAMIKAWGKDAGVIGKPLSEAVPELDGQPFLDILQKQFDTGELYEAREAPVALASGSERRLFYFDFTYKPLKNNTGEVWAILNNASDCTELVEARRK
ncbi:MAG: PAS domain S-box protein, partial [Chitinophagaceae bacterium]